MKNETLMLALVLAFAGKPDTAAAQQVQVGKTTLIVSEETTIQLDRAPERNESITWTIVTGEGDFGDGEIILSCAQLSTSFFAKNSSRAQVPQCPTTASAKKNN